jgi:hypothetical protein
MSEANGETLRAANHAAYLRRLGYVDAADALEAAGALIPESESDTGRGAATPEPQHPPTADEAARREGEVLLAALRRDCPDVFDRHR